jgi:hemerythrin-like domain-containing protein
MSTVIKLGIDPINTPLDAFVNCHSGILSTLDALSELPDLLAVAERSRRVAAAAERVFSEAVLEHHADEERELFPAVLRSARPGDEADHVQVMVARLTAEHRAVEELWKSLGASVKLAAKGKPAENLNEQMLVELIESYRAHAEYEEQLFLPLASEILGRDAHHMAALGLSIHMRHAKLPAAYI